MAKREKNIVDESTTEQEEDGWDKDGDLPIAEPPTEEVAEDPALADIMPDEEPLAGQKTVEEVVAEKEAEAEERASGQPSTAPPLPQPVAAVAHPEASPEHLDISDPQTAGVISTMQRELADVKRELNAVRTQAATTDGVTDAKSGGYPWQYFKKPIKEGDPESGWIVCAPGGKTITGHQAVGAFVRSLQKGRKALYNYGPCPTPNETGFGGALVPLLRNGGAKEIPASQILAFKWHVNPPLPDLVWPQLDEVIEDVRHFVCGDCDLELWFMKDNANTIRACFRHLRNPTERNGHGYQRAAALDTLHLQNLEFSGREEIISGDNDPRKVLQPAQG
jgi:hypothetical protein